MNKRYNTGQYEPVCDTEPIYSFEPFYIRFNVDIIAKENNLEKISIVRNIVKALPGNKLCYEQRGTKKNSDGKTISYYCLYVPTRFISNRDFEIFLDLGFDVNSIHTTISRKERRKLKYKRIHL
mgnify:CR=1 FL=1